MPTQRRIPMRMCIACRQMKPKRELLRVVCDAEGNVSIDETGRKPGRGAYVCPQEECLRRVIKQRQFSRALSHPIGDEVQEGLNARLESLRSGGEGAT